MDEEELVEADGPAVPSPDAEPSPDIKESLYTVKCSLGRLGCTPALREKIESVVRRVHFLAIRGTHLATELLYRAVRTGATLPAVDSQTWAYARAYALVVPCHHRQQRDVGWQRHSR